VPIGQNSQEDIPGTKILIPFFKLRAASEDH
jgi:hypothetical protein